MRYTVYFVLGILSLTAGTWLSFDHISLSAVAAVRSDSLGLPTADTLPSAEVATPAAPTAADYARFADSDRVWREQFARPYTIAELRERERIITYHRSDRDSVRDVVFQFMQAGQRDRAIAVLERWVGSHPGDREFLLSLARLLNQDGRSDDAIKRYRQILALRHQGQ
jgi:tetratricopeptide (TPR) repeat protein